MNLIEFNSIKFIFGNFKNCFFSPKKKFHESIDIGDFFLLGPGKKYESIDIGFFLFGICFVLGDLKSPF